MGTVSTTRSRRCAARARTPTGAGPTRSSSSTTSRRTSPGATSPSTPSPWDPDHGGAHRSLTAGEGPVAPRHPRGRRPARALLRGRPSRAARGPLRGHARAGPRSRDRGRHPPHARHLPQGLAERVRDEWLKAMKARRPSRAFEVMRETGILDVTCPELLAGVGHGAEQVARLRRLAPRRGVHGRVRGRPHPPHRRAAARRGQARARASGRDKTQDYTFYEHDRVGAEIAEPICAAPALLERRPRAHRGARPPPPLPLRVGVDRRRRAPLDPPRRNGAHRRTSTR